MQRILDFMKSLQLLGFLLVLLGLAIILNLLALSSLLQINTGLTQLQRDLRWRLTLGQVENAWLEQGLLLRRELLDPANPPSPQALEAANQNWETQIATLRNLTHEQESIDHLASLPPLGRTAFASAAQQTEAASQQAALNQAFSTNQAIDNLLEDQAFLAGNNVTSDQARLQSLITNYNKISLLGLGMLSLVGLWVLFWASRLPQPLLIIRMALAAITSGHYQRDMLVRMMTRNDSFGELAQAVHLAAEYLQTEEHDLHLEVERLTSEITAARRSRMTQGMSIEEFTDESRH